MSELREFSARLKHAPFANRHGLRGVSAFALFWFLRQRAPTVVFEVGVWRGFSTWVIEQALPEAEIHSFDPVFMVEPFLSRWKVGRTYRSPRVHYSTQDFSCAPIRELAAGHARPLVFFDDHQHKLPRVRQAREAGVLEVVFDDNMPIPYTHRSLEHERLDPASAPEVERAIEQYEVFPALWPVALDVGELSIREPGMDFPVAPEFSAVYRDRDWHSYVTWVRLASSSG